MRAQAGIWPKYDAYSPGRVHTFPTWDAVEDWTTASDSSWSLYQPQYQPDREQWWGAQFERLRHPAPDTREPCRLFRENGELIPPDQSTQCRGIPGFRTFPAAHFARSAGPLADAPNHHGDFSRVTMVVLAFASRVPRDSVGHRSGGESSGWMVFSPTPDSVRAVATVVPNDGDFVRQLAIDPGHQLVGLEVKITRSPFVTARARFAVDAPLPLSAMKPGDIGISGLVLVRDTTGDAGMESNPEQAIARMLPSRRVSADHMRIYWETYGIASADTVALSIRITPCARRDVDVSLLERLGRAIGLHSGAPTPPQPVFTLGWQESSADHRRVDAGGKVPIQGREVTLGLSQIPPGDYEVGLTATKGGETVSSRTVVRIGPLSPTGR